MAITNVRFTLSVSDDIVKQAEVLKKEVYFDKPYAEMYRQLIRLGMDALRTEQSRKPMTSLSSVGRNNPSA